MNFFLADENVPLGIVEGLRHRGHDVLWVRTHSPGLADKDVLHFAVEQERVVLTFDKDFGELVFREYATARGIVLLRLILGSPSATADYVVDILDRRDDWEGHFTVIERDRIRLVDLPKAE